MDSFLGEVKRSNMKRSSPAENKKVCFN